MHTRLLGALKCNAGAACFGKTVDVVSLDPERILDRTAHFLSPRLSAEDSRLEVNVIGSKPHFVESLADVSGI